MAKRMRTMNKDQYRSLPEKGVGECRTFTNDDRFFKIREVIVNPEIDMSWVWSTGVDPKTKKRFLKETNHTFYRIEVLGDDRLSDDELTNEDITLLGYTLDGRLMMLTIDMYDEVFLKSKTFKQLSKAVGDKVLEKGVK